MDESHAPSYADAGSGEPTFWDGVACVAALMYVIAAIVRVLADPLSGPHFYATVFRALAILALVAWGVAVLARKWREVRSRVVRIQSLTQA
jgi:hypothetical protein